MWQICEKWGSHCSEPEERAAGEFDRDSDGEDVAAASRAAGERRLFAAPPGVVKRAPHKHKKIKVGGPPAPHLRTPHFPLQMAALSRRSQLIEIRSCLIVSKTCTAVGYLG